MIVTSERGAPAEPQTLEMLVDHWEHDAAPGDPLVVIVHFAPDAQRAFNAVVAHYDSGRLSRRFPFLRWIRGDVLLRRIEQFGWQRQLPRNLVALGIYKDINADDTLLQQAFEDLARAPPTLFVANFADADAESVFSAAMSGNEIPVAEILNDFSHWAGTFGHGMIVILPRRVLALGQVERFCSRRPWAFTSGHLFSAENDTEPWLTYFEERLRPLLCANSIALRDRVARFVKELPPAAVLRVDRTAPTDIATLLRLAKALLEDGFYEVAYRLEVLCRTAVEQPRLIDLDVDIESSAAADPQERIVGFLEGAQNLPAVTGNAVLTGEAGAGKTTALLQIEAAWSLPRVTSSGSTSARWVPLLLEVESGPLWKQVRAQLFTREHSLRSLAQVDFHCLVTLCWPASAASVRFCGLFSSPVLLLLDGLEGLPRASRRELEREVSSLRLEIPDSGVLVAVRKGEVGEFRDFDCAELRPLDDAQVEAMLAIHGGPASLRNLLGAQGAPISRYLRNPFLLSAICRIAREGADVRSWNVRQILAVPSRPSDGLLRGQASRRRDQAERRRAGARHGAPEERGSPRISSRPVAAPDRIRDRRIA